VSDIGNKEVMAKNIKMYMDLNRKTRNDICDALGFKYTTFTDWIKGRAYPRIDKIEMMAHYFGIQKSDLIEEKHQIGTPYNPTRRIPILGRISASLPLYANEHIEGYTHTDIRDSGEYFALRVQGDSMTAARICEGDLLIVRKQDIVEDGQIAVVLVDGEDATVKRFYHGGKDTVTLMPQSLNPEHKPQTYNLRQVPIRVQGLVMRVEMTIK
jgi:repressor LexA